MMVPESLSALCSDLRRDFTELPRAFLERDPAAGSRLEVALLYPGFKAIVAHRFAHALWRGGRPFAARLVSELSRFATGIEIHPGAVLGNRVVIDHGSGIVIGETAIVEDDVTIYQGVTLGGTTLRREKRHPTIRAHSTLGASAVVLGDISVGPRARVGAGAVVTRDVAPGASVGGIPARALGVEHNFNVNARRASGRDAAPEDHET